jgi:hypothetical protein
MVYLALDKKSNAEKLEIQKSAAIFLNALVPNRYYA